MGQAPLHGNRIELLDDVFGRAECDHASLARTLAVDLGPTSRARRDAARRALLLHVETVSAMEHAIVDFYGSPDGAVLHSVDWRG